ncbi:hypothetical protein [Pseudomonas sp.]|uniref:hypothetical protein n=1 Tax=Pseudomonas sp. TaxID=306 RepID=UPI003264B099
MIIKLSPNSYSDDRALVMVKAGDTLEVNGELFDFTPLGEGDTLPASAISSAWFAGDVDRIAGELILTVFLPNPWNASPEQRFPQDIVDVPDGPVMLPQPLPVTETQQEQHEVMLALVDQLKAEQGIDQ